MKHLLTPYEQKVVIEMIRYYNALVTGKVLPTKQVLKILKSKKYG